MWRAPPPGGGPPPGGSAPRPPRAPPPRGATPTAAGRGRARPGWAGVSRPPRAGRGAGGAGAGVAARVALAGVGGGDGDERPLGVERLAQLVGRRLRHVAIGARGVDDGDDLRPPRRLDEPADHRRVVLGLRASRSRRPRWHGCDPLWRRGCEPPLRGCRAPRPLRRRAATCAARGPPPRAWRRGRACEPRSRTAARLAALRTVP